MPTIAELTKAHEMVERRRARDREYMKAYYDRPGRREAHNERRRQARRKAKIEARQAKFGKADAAYGVTEAATKQYKSLQDDTK